MLRGAAIIAKYLASGALLNVAIAWVCIAAHGRVEEAIDLYRNPRSGSPVGFLMTQRFGVEWANGCGRPGTLLSRFADSVHTYSPPPWRPEPWWPPEAVTFDSREFAVAAGWPLLSYSSWRTITTTVSPDKQNIDVRSAWHWGIPLFEPADLDLRPAVLAMRPIWTGVVANSVGYALVLAASLGMARAARRGWRRRRGRCGACGYPAGPFDTCSECGAGHAQAPPLPSDKMPCRA